MFGSTSFKSCIKTIVLTEISNSIAKKSVLRIRVIRTLRFKTVSRRFSRMFFRLPLWFLFWTFCEYWMHRLMHVNSRYNPFRTVHQLHHQISMEVVTDPKFAWPKLSYFFFFFGRIVFWAILLDIFNLVFRQFPWNLWDLAGRNAPCSVDLPLWSWVRASHSRVSLRLWNSCDRLIVGTQCFDREPCHHNVFCCWYCFFFLSLCQFLL